MFYALFIILIVIGVLIELTNFEITLERAIVRHIVSLLLIGISSGAILGKVISTLWT